MEKNRILRLSFAFLAPLFLALSLPKEALPVKAASSVSLGVSAASAWALLGDKKEQSAATISFSHDVFNKEDGSAFGFRITDGSEAAYQALGEDYTYLQKAMMVGEDTIASINASVDKSTIDATSFPKSAGGVYLVPILFYANKNILSIRFDNTWLNSRYGSGDTLELTFKKDLFAITKGETSYTLDQDIALSIKKDGSITTSYSYVAYEPDPVYGWDKDLSGVTYENVMPVEVSDITPVGTPVEDPAGWNRYNCYFVIFFDQPISTKYFPEITRPREILETYTSYYTAEDLAGLFDGKVHESALDCLLVDGKSIREVCAEETDATLQSLALAAAYAGDSFNVRGLTLSYNIGAKGLIDIAASHTLTVKKGLITPLNGKTEQDVSFTFDPLKRAWSRSNNGGFTSAPATDYGEIYQKQTPSSLPWIIAGSSVAGLLIVAGVVFFIVKGRKKA